MPVRNTACPHCGHETLVNVPTKSTKIRKVRRSGDGSDTKAACQSCGEKIAVYYG